MFQALRRRESMENTVGIDRGNTGEYIQWSTGECSDEGH